MGIESGEKYIIKNVKGGTVLDKSGSDGFSVLGWEAHGSENQRWKVEQIEGTNQWSIKNKDDDRYLAIALGADEAGDDTPVVVSEQEFAWDIFEDSEIGGAFRVVLPGTSLNLDLTNNGDHNNGTRVALWGQWEGLNQVWYFEQD